MQGLEDEVIDVQHGRQVGLLLRQLPLPPADAARAAAAAAASPTAYL